MERNSVDALKMLHDIDASNRRKSEDLGASRRNRGFCCLSLVQRNKHTMNNAPAVLHHEKFIVLAAVKQSEQDLSCKQIQNQVANKSRSSSCRCYALRNTLLNVLRVLRSDENIILLL